MQIYVNKVHVYIFFVLLRSFLFFKIFWRHFNFITNSDLWHLFSYFNHLFLRFSLQNYVISWRMMSSKELALVQYMTYNVKVHCIVGMTRLCKRWVYFPNLHLSKSLSLSFSSPPSATVYFYPQTFSRPLGLCVRRVLLLTNHGCSGAGMHFRSCFCSCAVNCRTAFHLSRKAPPLAVIDRSCSHSDHELLGLSKLIQ